MKKILSKIKEKAVKDNVPIIMDEGLDFIAKKIKEYNVKSILEIGTAVAYSAISFAALGCFVVSIERNTLMYEEAVKNVKETNTKELVNLVFFDALLYETDKKFDLIFIDAAKAQYEKFFNKYKKNLNEKGIIICDNLNFHNLNINEVSRSTRQLIQKINKFKEFLSNNDEFATTFFNIGDGMSVSIRK